MMVHLRQRPITEPPFWFYPRFFLLSLLAHLALLALFSLSHFFGWFSAPAIPYEKAIRVDVVGLPDKLPDNPVIPVSAPEPTSATNSPSKAQESSVSQERTTAPSEAKKTEAMLKEKPNTDGKKVGKTDKKEVLSKEREQAAKALKQLQALATIESEVQNQEASLKQLRQMVFKGNKIIAGSSLTGIEKLEVEEYVDRVEAHVKSFWALPQWLAKKKLRAKALVKWDSRGMPTTIQIVESSGDDEFDEVVMSTLQKAIPFPP